MDTASLESAYRRILEGAEAGPFSDPPAGEWDAAMVLAHVTVNDDLLLEATRSVLAGLPGVSYDNGRAVDEDHLRQQAAAGLASLIDRLQTSSHNLIDAVRQLDHERAAVQIPVHLADGGHVVVDQPMPIGRLLDIHAEVHLPSHLSQMEALRS
jgi:hypothetical protein